MFKKTTFIFCLVAVLSMSCSGAFAFFRNKCCDPCDPCCGSKVERKIVKKKEVIKPVVVEPVQETPVVTKQEKTIEQEPGIAVEETVTKTEKTENNYYPGLW